MSNRMPHCVHGTEMALYASYFKVGHNAYEFLIDFGQFRPEDADIAMHTRIVLGPTHAKVLAAMLQGAVSQHEIEHGSIQDPDDAPLSSSLHSTPER